MTSVNQSAEIPYSTMVMEVEKWRGIHIQEVDQFFQLVGPIIAPSFSEISWLLLLTDKRNESHTKWCEL